MKSGADMRDLGRRFEEIKKMPQSRASFKSPLESLRELVPWDDSSDNKMREFVCDEGLIIRQQEPDLWEEYLNEAPVALAEFNKALSGAIRQDDDWSSTSSLDS